MNEANATAIGLGAILVGLGLLTAWFQIAGLRKLAARKLVPSDELAYFRGRYRRRLVTAAVLVALGTMIGGAYASGMEREAERLGEHREPVDPDAPKPELKPEDKDLLRFWGIYWIVVLVLVFALVAFATIDAWATRRYWMGQYKHIRDDHQLRLRRDLAVLRKQKEQSRAGKLNLPPVEDAGEPEA